MSCLPHSDVEDVASHGAGHSHIAEALLGDDDARDEIGNTRPGREEREPHGLQSRRIEISLKTVMRRLNSNNSSMSKC